MNSGRRTIEVALAGVRLESARTAQGGNHLVVVNLVWPRPLIAVRTTIKTVMLSDGQADTSGWSWTDRILFKEDVEGPFGISADVSDELADDLIAGFMSSVASFGIKLAGDGIGDTAAGPLAGGLAAIPLEYMGKTAAAAGKAQAQSAGAGTLDLQVGPDWKAGETRNVRLPLTANRSISRMRRQMQRGRMAAKPERIMQHGEANGFIDMTVLPYE